MAPIKRLMLAAAGAVVAAVPLIAQPTQRSADLPGSSFAIVGAVRDNAVLTAKSGGNLVELKAKPLAAVRLNERVDATTAALFGAKAEAPLDVGRVLTGWPERPGLYCDLLRKRGLGLSTACLRDRDGDGRFDEGVRYDFNSGSGDLLGVTPSGKIIGVRTTSAKPGPIPLAVPVSYAPTEVPHEITGRLVLKWRRVKVGDKLAAQLWITTPENYTGTEGVSAQVAQFALDQAPLDGELYGVRLRILGFGDKGAMRYQVLDVREGAAVPLMFRGYTFRIIML